MRRSLIASLSLALLLAAVPAAHAQLGGLKKKVADKVAGKKPDTTATVAAKPKCDKSSIVITSDVVDRYLKGLAARDAEVQKLAKEPGKTGAYYSALLKRQAVQRRREEFDLHRGPDWERHLAIQKNMRKDMTQGDGSAMQKDMQEEAQLTQSMDPSQVQLPELEWEDQQKGNIRMDSVMRVAGGFSECDWQDVGAERMPRMVYILADDPQAKDFQGFGTPKEATAIRPKIAQLARGLNVKYVSPEDKARLKAEDEEAKRLAEQPVSTGNPVQDCMNKASTDFMKEHKADFDAAQKKKDNDAIMKLAQLQAKAMAKCQPASDDE